MKKRLLFFIALGCFLMIQLFLDNSVKAQCIGNAVCIPLMPNYSPPDCELGVNCVETWKCPEGAGGAGVVVGCTEYSSSCVPSCPYHYANCSAANNCSSSASPTPTGGGGAGCISSRGHTELPVVCENTGFYGRTYATGRSTTDPVAETYSCAPYAAPIGGETCLYWMNKWTGYLNIPEAGDYEFWISYHPKLKVQIDVNQNGTFDTACGSDTVGDNYVYISGSCKDRYRYQRLVNWGLVTSAGGGTCWEDYATRTYCDYGSHCQNADYRTYYRNRDLGIRTFVIGEYYPEVIVPLGVEQVGTTECPIAANNQHAARDGGDEPSWFYKGTGNSYFTRTLGSGSVLVDMAYTSAVDKASLMSHALTFKYRKVGSTEWINLNDASTYPSGVCPVTPCLEEISSIDAWWQVKDADVVTNGGITTNVAESGQVFDLEGNGGSPGVVVYTGSTDLTTSNVSEEGWLANTSTSQARVFNSKFFENRIPSDATINEINSSSIDGTYLESGTVSGDGYIWFVYDAGSTGLDLNITSDANLGSNKVVLFVKNANLTISGNINVTDGAGFFLAVSEGSVSVDASVGGGSSANLEGIYIADGSFSSGTGGSSSDSQLWVRGTVAAYGGANLERDLGASNNDSPAEFFEYAPDQELLFPISLSSRVTNWREIAP